MQSILLFIEFFKIGLFGFGGGYAMIPLMDRAVEKHEWLTPEQFADIVAVAGSAPGPIATNSALFIGYQTSGIGGAVIAGVSTLLPSLIIVFLLIKVIARYQNTSLLSSGMYGIHPVITALILFAGIRMGRQNGLFSLSVEYSQLIIMAAAFILLYKKVSPVWVVTLSGIAGILIYHF
ncbi:chromate transporter [Halobacillus sp. Marseille-P3879]|uniref:chromate transporter n=1 Tax=Halobacillus TaxID=45667 RepID=UPI000C7A54F2|nr:chromate transporter [Halobacillus sp. Marseille-P3879]